MRARGAAAAVLSALALGFAAVGEGYEPGTHREMAQQAATSSLSVVDQYLKTNLGFASGVRHEFFGRNVERLVGDGAEIEDFPFLRVLNHFHDPLRPWENAGLDALAGLVRGQSA